MDVQTCSLIPPTRQMTRKFELFVPMTWVLGAGIPHAYMFLQPSSQTGLNYDSRGRIIQEFFYSVKEEFPSLRPKIRFH